jgi:GT2 family glycosyltransferase
MSTAIVILSRKATNVIPCVESIRRHDPGFEGRVIVVDDGAGTAEARARLAGVTWLPGAEPFIFARNANLGIRAADGDVILLNDDTELASRDGFSKLSRSSRDGITSAQIGGPGYFDPDFCSFVAVFIPEETQEIVGLLDERFRLYGYEDNDYCRRVRQAGMSLHGCSDCIVNHYHPDRSTFHGPNNQYQGDNLVIFDRKWGIKREYTWPEHLAQIAESKS